jgi:deoxyribodipyrimidine photo-lyase
MQTAKVCSANAERHAAKFLSELGWREFSHHLLYHFPSLPERNFRPMFDAFPWDDNERAFKAWTQGRTGYPIVDAGMRELWATGYMHNRVRMVAASFLIKHLLIPWQRGQAWFWDTLVDADLANNAASWQWVAGSGADAAPYFRIFNPVIQGEKFDPDGAYVRRWVPELKNCEPRLIHRPWQSSNFAALAYQKPIVDHDRARIRALAAYKSIAGQEARSRQVT